MKPVFAVLFFISLLSSFSFVHAQQTPPSPRFLVHLLDYLAQDYGGAVQNHVVINPSEYQEQVEFGKIALETAEQIEVLKIEPGFLTQMQSLVKMIATKADAGELARKARVLQADVLRLSKIEVAPKQWPSLKNGRALYAQNCTSCHGVDGHGDGVAAKGLDPQPSNFHDLERMNQISPFQSFNVIRLGVPGTAMSPQQHLSDKEIWDLAFYIISLRHSEKEGDSNFKPDPSSLEKVASSSDQTLLSFVGGSTAEEKKESIRKIRTHSASEDNLGVFIELARGSLQRSYEDYKAGRFDEAKKKALMAYLEGIEPIEPKLRANDLDLNYKLEADMAAYRMAIENRAPDIETKLQIAQTTITAAEQALAKKPSSPWVAFSLASGILLREGFEAVLLIIALLGVIRASNAQKAARYVHTGWVSAVGLGLVAWFFSGWLMKMSGAGREMMEAIISVLAVSVLLYIGFWLHSRTEIHRWKAFIDGKVKRALENKNRFGLVVISFVAVFREAFETVLFLRAIWLESGDENRYAITLGVLVSFVAVLVLAWALLKFSSKLPIRKLFDVSSTLMILLAVILIGKGLHSFQECGLIGVTPFPISLRFELLGIYPYWQTILGQALILIVSLGLWIYGKKPPASVNTPVIA